jgi:hypothetical protein
VLALLPTLLFAPALLLASNRELQPSPTTATGASPAPGTPNPSTQVGHDELVRDYDIALGRRVIDGREALRDFANAWRAYAYWDWYRIGLSSMDLSLIEAPHGIGMFPGILRKFVSDNPHGTILINMEGITSVRDGGVAYPCVVQGRQMTLTVSSFEILSVLLDRSARQRAIFFDGPSVTLDGETLQKRLRTFLDQQ